MKHRRDEPKKVPFTLPTKESATNNQVTMLLGIVDCLAHNLRAPTPYNGTEGTVTAYELDKGVKFALETSVIKALTTLDGVIDNCARWDVKSLVRMEKDSEKFLKANIDFVKSQKASSDHVRRPSFRLQPKLVRITDGTFAAFLGDLNSGTALVGQGQTVEDALRAFDDVCNGKQPDQMVEWLAKHEKQNNTKATDEKRPMDSRTIDATPVAEGAGKNDSGNCKRPGSRRVSRAKQARKASGPRRRSNPDGSESSFQSGGA